MRGYEKCDELKRLRKRIADANGIPYEITECTSDDREFCLGFCEKCDAEEAFLMTEIRKLEAAGKDTSLDGQEADYYVFGYDIPVVDDDRVVLMGIPAPIPFDTEE